MLLTIAIPENTKALVKTGQKIDLATPLFESKTSTEIVIPITKKLNIPPDKIFHCLKKFVGEEVKEGDILAIKKTFFSPKKIVCQCSGIIKEIDHHRGQLILNSYKDKKRIINSFVIGETVEIEKNTLKIKIKEGKEFSLKKSSEKAFGGEVFYLHPNSNFTSSEIKNKIIIAESLSSYLQSKAEAIGSLGFVTLRKTDDMILLKFAQLKNIDDIKKIFVLNFPYCFIDAASFRIVFYA